MWQDYAVGAIVAVAALYVLWYWMPGVWRRRLGKGRPALAQKPGCGSCSSCGGCASAPTAPAPSGVAAEEAPGYQPVWMAPER